MFGSEGVPSSKSVTHFIGRSMTDGLVHEPMLSQLASVVSSSSQLKFAQTVSSKTAVVGDTVEFTRTEDSPVGVVVVAPTGKLGTRPPGVA